MTHDDTISRREMIKRSLLLGAIAAGSGHLLAACGDDGGTCGDLSGLNSQQRQTRTTLEYVEATPFPDKRCDNCQLYVAPAQGSSCGTCQVVAGPVTPAGHCKSWVVKQG